MVKTRSLSINRLNYQNLSQFVKISLMVLQGELIKQFMDMSSTVVPTFEKYFMFFTIRCLTVQVFRQGVSDGNDFTTFQG